MLKYIVKRLLGLIPTWALAAFSVFLLLRFLPGDAAMILLGTNATPEQIKEVQDMLGLNRPFFEQLGVFFVRLLHLDLGTSLITREPIMKEILHRLPVTAALAVMALLVSIIVGIPSGIMAAVKHNSRWDKSFMLFALLGVSIPNFWLGLMLIIAFGVILRWFPFTGFVPFSVDFWKSLHYLILPSIALGLTQAAIVARMARSSMLDVLSEDYVRTARSKGLAHYLVVWRHAAPNAMNPILTALGTNFGNLMGGTVVIESVFNLPGLGRYVVQAIFARDYPVVQAVLLLSVTIYALINLIVDISYGLVDPRIRYD